jgi:luciferase family oxidoreductase group 1
MALALGVLDQSPVREGGTPAQALGESVALAQACERFGYGRYWLAEHHNASGLACTAPEILIGRIAGATKRLRVGAGGVMLSHYSSLKVAETFGMLEALFPGRIDLGLGRAPGSDGLTSYALSPILGQIAGSEQYPRQVADLLGYLHGQLEEGHPFAAVTPQPVPESPPQVWLLGSSDQSASLAAQFGCPFSFAHFLSGHGGDKVMADYIRNFRPSSFAAAPQGSICVFVLCAETEAEAQRIAASRSLWRLRVEETGTIQPFPSPETALAQTYSDTQRARIAHNRAREVVGTPDRVKAQLEDLARRYGVNEIMVLTIAYDFADRVKSYELLAREFGLNPAS